MPSASVLSTSRSLTALCSTGSQLTSRLRAVAERVLDVPHETVALFVLNFEITDRALQHRVPVHQALAAVDQSLLIQLHKGLSHGLGQLVVHREVFAAPVHAVAHAAHLGRDGVA